LKIEAIKQFSNVAYSSKRKFLESKKIQKQWLSISPDFKGQERWGKRGEKWSQVIPFRKFPSLSFSRKPREFCGLLFQSSTFPTSVYKSTRQGDLWGTKETSNLRVLAQTPFSTVIPSSVSSEFAFLRESSPKWPLPQSHLGEFTKFPSLKVPYLPNWAPLKRGNEIVLAATPGESLGYGRLLQRIELISQDCAVIHIGDCV
jgi:hypothetical protein